MKSLLPRDPIAGTTNATGVANIKYKVPASFYVAAILVAKVDSGTPNWIVSSLAGGAPLAFGAGRNVVLGPLLLYPGEQLNIAVNGADASTKVLGQFVGFQGESIEEIAESLTQLPGGFNSRSIVDVNPVVRISANSASGQAVVSVADITPFHVGQTVVVVQPGLPSSQGVIQSIAANDASGGDPSGTLTLDTNLSTTYNTTGSVMVASVVGFLTNPPPFNLTQISGQKLTGAQTGSSFGLPMGARFAVSTLNNPLAVGTYTFDVQNIPYPAPPLQPVGSANLTNPFLIGPGGGKALLLFKVGAQGGGGTVTFSLFARDDTPIGIITAAVLASAATTANGQGALAVAPGIAVTANATASSLVGPTPRVQVVIATAAIGFAFVLDLMP